MPRNRHKLPRKTAIPVTLAVVAALGWTSIGMPGWANEEPRQPSAGSAPSSAAAPPVACDDQDSPKKGWYQAVYVHTAGKDNSAKAVPNIQRVMWNSDQVFEASAKRFGQGDSRRLRFVQDKNCRIDVMSVGVEGLPARPSFGATRMKAQAAVAAVMRKADRASRERFKRTRPVYFYDNGARGCGVSTIFKPKGRADLHTGRAAVSWGCATVPAVTHELIHQFGVNHCNNKRDQGGDPICRGYDRTPRCNDTMATVVLDCAKDEFHYFHPRPASGSPLARNPKENVANSPYLITDQPMKPLKMRLANKAGGKCLTADGAGVVQSTCGTGAEQSWSRAIDKDGYFTFTVKGKCLTAASGDRAAATFAACKAGDGRQQWWMPSGRGSSADRYEMVNRETGRKLKADGRANSKGASPIVTARGGGSWFGMQTAG
ncbi:RICIN domain-containing protein [Streptomyces sp. NPDC001922]|uniref:RICIN domain-containing protein n=1 Tax=Streptomyces sp. NPDC001922 TaxID=3364624 RepID=UPI003699EE3B